MPSLATPLARLVVRFQRRWPRSPCADSRQPAALGRHARVQRAYHGRGNHPARARRAAAHRADRRRRRIEGRHRARFSTGCRRNWGSRCCARRTPARVRRCGSGFAAVTGDLVVIQDADLEYSPEEYPDLIELICKGQADVVLRLAVSRPAPRVPVHALPRQPHRHAGHQHPVQHDADRHGDLLQGDADRRAAVVHARVERLRHRARNHGQDLQARLSSLRNSDHLRRSRLR